MHAHAARLLGLCRGCSEGQGQADAVGFPQEEMRSYGAPPDAGRWERGLLRWRWSLGLPSNRVQGAQRDTLGLAPSPHLGRVERVAICFRPLFWEPCCERGGRRWVEESSQHDEGT